MNLLNKHSHKTDYFGQFVATIVLVELGLVQIWLTVIGDFEAVANERPTANAPVVTFHQYSN